MKRILLLTVCFSLFLGGMAFAQSADEVYIKAMQAQNMAEKTKLLKEYVSQYAGKGNKYDNYAYANLCLLQYQAKQFNAETIGLAEKAIAAGGLDDLMKGALLSTITDIYLKTNQYDKVKTSAQQVIQHANAVKGKEAEAGNAKKWTQTIGVAHYLSAQAMQKSGDINGALQAYNQAYTITKDPAVLVEVKKIAKTYYDAGKMAEAEQVYRFLAGTGKDPESFTILPQILAKQGREAEALQMFKDMYAKNKSAGLAYNMAIMFNNAGKTDEAVNYFLDAYFLDSRGMKQCQDMARSLFFKQDKEWNNRIKLAEESQGLIKDWTDQINKKFGEKSEEELTPDERREYRKLKELIDKETITLNNLVNQMNAGSGKFNALVAAAKKRTGK
jgi:hypothetical protein